MGKFEAYTKSIRVEDAAERLRAITALANFADQRGVDGSVHIPLMKEEGLVAAIVKIAKYDEDDAKAQAFAAIFRMGRAGVNKTPLFKFPGLVEVVVNSARANHGRARVTACTVLASIGITEDYYDYLSKAANASLLDTLVRIAKDKSEGEARMWSIQAISHFARSPPIAPYLLASNILPTMMEVVRKAGTDLSRWRGNACEFWALSFLMNIAQADAAAPEIDSLLRVNGIYELLSPLATQTSMQALNAAATLAFVVGEDEEGKSPSSLLTNHPSPC